MEPSASYDAPEFDWKSAEGEIDKARRDILSLCSPTPTPRDEIIRLSEYPVPIVAAALLEMELGGDIHVEPDGRVGLTF